MGEYSLSRTVMPATASILAATEAIDGSIGKFLEARGTIGYMGRYESDDASHSLMLMLIRSVEGVLALAQRDLVLLPAAFVLCRTSFELYVKVCWMLHPEDPLGRDVRWLAYLEEEERSLMRFSERLKRQNQDDSRFLAKAESIRLFRLQVAAVLPSGYDPVRIPNLSAMLESIGRSEKYGIYAEASKFTHGAFGAAALYQRHLGDAKEFGEFIRPQDWLFPLMVSWDAFRSAGSYFLFRMGGNPNAFLPEGSASSVNRIIGAVGS